MSFGTNSSQFANGPQGGIFTFHINEDRSISGQKMTPYYEPKTFQQMQNCVKEGNLCYRHEDKYVMMTPKDAKHLKLGQPILLRRGLVTFNQLNRGDALLGPRPDKTLGALNHGTSRGNHATPNSKSATSLSAPPNPKTITDPPLVANSDAGSVVADPKVTPKNDTQSNAGNGAAKTADSTTVPLPDANSKTDGNSDKGTVDSKTADATPAPKTDANIKTPWFAEVIKALKDDRPNDALLSLGVQHFGENTRPALTRIVQQVSPIFFGTGLMG